jgi:hypothetical protein
MILGLSACDTMTQPISSGDFDPLRPPGSGNANASAGPSFRAGQFVRAAMDNTAFFKNRPKGDMDADKLLTRGTSMKVISNSASYVKVELDSGEVGFVPTVMVEDPSAAASANGAPVNPGEFQVYPPLGGYGEPLPPVDPAGLPPEGAIPTVIDPEAPVNPAPVPPVTPQGDAFAAPAATPPSPAPLPPNGEEEEEVPAPEKKTGTEVAPKLEE